MNILNSKRKKMKKKKKEKNKNKKRKNEVFMKLNKKKIVIFSD